MRYLHARRRALGGYLPARNPSASPLKVPPLEGLSLDPRGTAEREISTTMAFVRILTALLKGSRHRQAHRADRARRGAHLWYGGPVPPGRHLLVGRPALHAGRCRDADVVSRGQEGPDDRGGHQRGGLGVLVDGRGDLLRQSRHRHGAVLFIIRCSAFSAWRLSLGRRETCRRAVFCWAAPPGRTTLAGEGLQHQDGHSQLVATTIPNCRAYDPTYAYELAVIIQDGLKRMYAQNENVFYYISLMNENYAQPALPAGTEAGIRRAAIAYVPRAPRRASASRCSAAAPSCASVWPRPAELLEQQFGIAAEVFSITSFSELAARGARLRSLGTCCTRRPSRACPTCMACSRVRRATGGRHGLRAQCARPDSSWLSQRYLTLGTDGFGRSDARGPLRAHFEVDARVHHAGGI